MAAFFGMATLGRQVKMKINRDVSVSLYSSSLRRCRGEGVRNPTVLLSKVSSFANVLNFNATLRILDPSTLIFEFGEALKHHRLISH